MPILEFTVGLLEFTHKALQTQKHLARKDSLLEFKRLPTSSRVRLLEEVGGLAEVSGVADVGATLAALAAVSVVAEAGARAEVAGVAEVSAVAELCVVAEGSDSKDQGSVLQGGLPATPGATFFFLSSRALSRFAFPRSFASLPRGIASFLKPDASTACSYRK